VFLSADGSRIAHTGGYSYGPFWPATEEVTTISATNNPDKIFPTAVSGNGKVIAASKWSNSAPGNILVGLDYAGSTGVGMIAGGLWAWEPDNYGPTFWRATGGVEWLSEALLRRGLIVDVDSTAQPMLSVDGHTVVASGARRLRDGRLRSGCFIGTFGDLDPSDSDVPPTAGTLPAPSAPCGDGDLDAGEACDDGNHNDADGCTARCARPALGASEYGTCSVRASGKVACWGDAALTLVGSDVGKSWSATEVQGLSDAVQVASGRGHSCAVLESGGVQCWGDNGFGQLGDGSTVASVVPVDVAGVSDAVQVSVQNQTSCAVVRDGTLYCWGANALDALADDTSGDSALPVEIPGIDGVTQVELHKLVPCLDGSCRSGRQTIGLCVLRNDASMWCWGGGPSASGAAHVSSPAPIMTGVRQITSSTDHLCVLTESGSAACWGQYSPWTAYALPVNTIALASGYATDCALTSDGLVDCFNYALAARRISYGDDLCTSRFYDANVSPVLGITNAMNIAAGESHVCAALADGSVKCWGGDALGQLGFGHAYGYCPAGLDRPVSVVDLPD
jgi:cysteine-rich repeat protein